MTSMMTILQAAKHFKRDRSNILRWVEKGFFPNAVLNESPAGNYWTIPEADVKAFKPPAMGRKPNIKPENVQGRKAA